jgi:hypothetical protein
MKNRLHLTAVLAVGLTWGSACQAGSGFQFALYINVANTGAGDTVSWGCVNGPNVAARQIAVAPESSSWSLELGLVSGGSSTDRIDVLFAFCRLASYPVTLFVALPRSEIFTAWLNRNGGTFLALLFFFVAAVVAYRHAIRLQVALQNERRQNENMRQDALDHLQKIASRVPGVVFQYRGALWWRRVRRVNRRT